MEFKLPIREQNSNKGTFGKVLNISGSKYMPGAAYLSSIAALKIGCGYLILCNDDEVLMTVTKLLPEAVLAPLKVINEQIKQADVILIGCGLSTSKKARNILLKILNSDLKIPVVIDADGLNILSKIDNPKLPKNLILTPHPMEGARLLGVSLEEILKDRNSAAREISQKFNCTTILKGHNTVVCSKDLEIHINTTGNSALSKAGTGDILAGMIAGLCAQGLSPFDAAKTGVHLHGLTGELASRKMTQYCVLASDLPQFFQDAIKEII